MNSTGNTKVCPRCAETIKAAARICPFCQTRLTWFGLWREELLGGVVVLTLFGLLACIVILAERADSAEGRLAAQLSLAKRHRFELSVVETRVEQAGKTNSLWLLGVVTNTGKLPWRVEQLEARLHDPAGALLDTRQLAFTPGFVVPAGGAHAFRTEFGPSQRTNDLRIAVHVHQLTEGHLPPDDY